MEREDKRPEVWVKRRLMRRGCNCTPYVIGYFASKARVQTVKTRFTPEGQEFKVYEVEFETPTELEDLCFDGDYGAYAETGDWVKVDRVFKVYAYAREYVNELNKQLINKQVARVPKSMVDETIESAKKETAFARRLEKYFDGKLLSDTREL